MRAMRQHPIEIAPQHDEFGDASEDAEWCGEEEMVGHLCATVLAHEKMIVHERLERAALHLVAKMMRRIEARDARRQLLRHEEVSRTPRHLFIRADQSGEFPADGALVRGGNRRAVQIDMARRIEAAFDRRIDPGVDGDGLHSATLYSASFSRRASNPRRFELTVSNLCI